MHCNDAACPNPPPPAPLREGREWPFAGLPPKDSMSVNAFVSHHQNPGQGPGGRTGSPSHAYCSNPKRLFDTVVSRKLVGSVS